MVYFISRILFAAILKIFFGLEVKGKENLPGGGPFILACNHVSHIDPVVVGVACNRLRVSFVAKKELFEIPIYRHWFRSMGCIKINRETGGSGALKEALFRLKKGGVVCIFPEGTRSKDGKLQEARPGVGLLVSRAGVPVIPVYVKGTGKVLPRGATRLKRAGVKIDIGRVIDISAGIRMSDKRKKYASIGAEIMNAIAELSGNAGQGNGLPVGPERTPAR